MLSTRGRGVIKDGRLPSKTILQSLAVQTYCTVNGLQDLRLEKVLRRHWNGVVIGNAPVDGKVLLSLISFDLLAFFRGRSHDLDARIVLGNFVVDSQPLVVDKDALKQRMAVAVLDMPVMKFLNVRDAVQTANLWLQDKGILREQAVRNDASWMVLCLEVWVWEAKEELVDGCLGKVVWQHFHRVCSQDAAIVMGILLLASMRYS